eukprot:1159328-Pelagomonas_calceolata.AAC.9
MMFQWSAQVAQAAAAIAMLHNAKIKPSAAPQGKKAAKKAGKKGDKKGGEADNGAKSDGECGADAQAHGDETRPYQHGKHHACSICAMCLRAKHYGIMSAS